MCVLFGSDKNAYKLVKSPVTFWTTAAQKFRDHDLQSKAHKTASLRADYFLKVMRAQMVPIDQQLQSALSTQIAENKLKLHRIVITIIFCGRQNIPLQGHREMIQHEIQAILKHYSNSELTVEIKFTTLFRKYKQRAKYTSKDIQNDCIS